jgi:hypothetical protein
VNQIYLNCSLQNAVGVVHCRTRAFLPVSKKKA